MASAPATAPGARGARRPHRRALALAALLACAASATAMLTGAFDSLERETLRARFELRAEPPPEDVVVVAIDDTTFSELERQWPFPRSLHARVVDRLRAAGAREIVYDVQFTEPTRPREDLALFDALGRAGGAVLATSESDGRGHTNVLGGEENLALIHARAGASDLSNDSGGIVTRYPYSVAGLRSLAVATSERVDRRVSPGEFEDGEAFIDYRGGPGTFRTVSFSAVLRGRVRAGVFRDKIVVVGASAPTLRDVHATPTGGDELMAGAEVQANAIWTALHGNPLRGLPPYLNLLLVALLALVAPLARLRFGVMATVTAAAGVAAAFLAGAQIAFQEGLIVAVVAPVVSLVVAAVATVAASHLLESRERRRIARDNERLEARVRERTAELRETQLEIVHRLGAAVESRDIETGLHIERITRLCRLLALAAGVGEADAELIRDASALHDVGKIGIPDHILRKPGKLDDDEWAVVKEHPAIGAAILAGSSSPVVRLAEEISLTHHERWDGSGYPAGLRGEEIPLAGRICAICDVFDALLSPRPYKDAWSLEDSVAEIEAQSGKHFDPRLIDVFLANAADLYAVWASLRSIDSVRALPPQETIAAPS